MGPIQQTKVDARIKGTDRCLQDYIHHINEDVWNNGWSIDVRGRINMGYFGMNELSNRDAFVDLTLIKFVSP